jgi:hypothetical protein
MCKFDDFSKDELQELLDTSNSYADVIRRTGLSIHGSNYRTLQNLIKKHELDTSTLKMNKKSASFRGNRKQPLEEILVEHSTYPRSHLKPRLVDEGYLDYICTGCNNTGEWNNKKLVLQLEHINGNSCDNRIENLTFLCPNCHSQTPTYAGANCNRKKKIWNCGKCNNEISVGSTHCMSCVEFEKKFETTYDELYDLVVTQQQSYVDIGNQFGVSGTAIKKRCKCLGIPLEKRR